MKLKGKRIFITGGTGFIGSHLVERIADDNELILYDTLHRNALSYTNLAKNKNVTIAKGDVLDSESLSKHMEDIDIVIHLAAIAGVGAVESMPTKTLNINLFGTHNVLEQCRKKGIKRIITFSTSEVYGPYIYQASEDGMTTLGPIGQPRWNYAMSKLAAEFLVHSYHVEYGIKFTSVRPFNVYGPRQIGVGAVHNFIVNALKNQPLVVHKPGSQVRSWCYVSDLIDAMDAILTNKKAEGEVFNIGNPMATSTTVQTAEAVLRLCPTKSIIELKENNNPDVHIRVPSIEKAAKLLGYDPKVSFEEGLKRTIEWYSRLPKGSLV